MGFIRNEKRLKRSRESEENFLGFFSLWNDNVVESDSDDYITQNWKKKSKTNNINWSKKQRSENLRFP